VDNVIKHPAHPLATCTAVHEGCIAVPGLSAAFQRLYKSFICQVGKAVAWPRQAFRQHTDL
jgi:hypothetical protein